MVAFELVKDPKTKEPDAELTAAVLTHAEQRGLILLSCGTSANVVRLLAPLTIPDAVLSEAWISWRRRCATPMAANPSEQWLKPGEHSAKAENYPFERGAGNLSRNGISVPLKAQCIKQRHKTLYRVDCSIASAKLDPGGHRFSRRVQSKESVTIG